MTGMERRLLSAYALRMISIKRSTSSSDGLRPLAVRKKTGRLSSNSASSFTSGGIMPASSAARSRNSWYSLVPFLRPRAAAYLSSVVADLGGASRPRSSLLRFPGSRLFSKQNRLNVIPAAMRLSLKNCPNAPISHPRAHQPATPSVVYYIQRCRISTTLSGVFSGNVSPMRVPPPTGLNSGGLMSIIPQT